MENNYNDNDNDNKDDNEDDYDNEPRITASEGLSKETLEMLKLLGLNNNNNNNNDNDDRVFMSNGDPIREILNLQTLDVTLPKDAVDVLKSQGVVRLDNILSTDLCDRCIISINNTLSIAINEGSDHYDSNYQTGFGNIDASHNRWDMFVNKNDDAIADSYLNMFDNKDSVLNSVFHNLFDGQDADVHEFGAIISTNGAGSQRIHSDTTYQSNCPLYTVFIAMQDIVHELGPTIFIKGTNTSSAHLDLRHRRDDFLSEAIYHQALLKSGDVVIMDSRTFHCGDKNSLGNRILLYFTLLNPSYTDMGGGSKHENINLTLHSLSNRSSYM